MPAAERFHPRYDVVVVGARCAGASTAMLLARQGLRVLAIDRSAFGSDTLSTLALMRGGVLQLKRWGLLDAIRTAATPPVRVTSFRYGSEVVRVPIKPRDGIDALYAPRRTVLDAVLATAAARAGAHVVHGARLENLVRSDEGRVRGVVIRDREGHVHHVACDLVVGADGQRSTVARLVSARQYHLGFHAGGVVYGLWRGVDLDGYHWYYQPKMSVGAIPTNDGLTLVFVVVPGSRFMHEIRHDMEGGYHRVMRQTAPDLAARLGLDMQAERLRGFPGMPGYFRQSWGPGWALVGDAGYFKDPFTAHGITDALRDAELLSRAAAAGSERALAAYQAARDHLSLGVFAVTDRIASFDWDLDEVRELHRELSQEMQKEVTWLLDLDRAAAPAIEAGAESCP
jgi:2-polyprenyl-6-methoxyphenol hydroxylase-like FAD-dependent oxidoreductase